MSSKGSSFGDLLGGDELVRDLLVESTPDELEIVRRLSALDNLIYVKRVPLPHAISLVGKNTVEVEGVPQDV